MQKTVKNKKTKQDTMDSFQCPYCDQIITLAHRFNEKYIIKCPTCGHIGLINREKKDKKAQTKPEYPLPTTPWIYQPFFRSKISGLILITFGFIFLFHPTISNLKISLVLFFTGGILFTLVSEKKFIILPQKTANKNLSTKKTANTVADKTHEFMQKNKLVVSEKIALLIVTTTLIIFVLTKPEDVEIFVVLLYLSLLIIKELIDEFTPIRVKKRINIFIIIFFIFFIYIIAERIITILNI